MFVKPLHLVTHIMVDFGGLICLCVVGFDVSYSITSHFDLGNGMSPQLLLYFLSRWLI